MSEASRSSAAVSTNDSHANVECQKGTATHKESSPPNIFNNSNSLKYLHKKFKRVASAIIEEHCDKIKANAAANANLLSPESSSARAASVLSSNVNGETTVTAAASMATAVQSSHINERETNSQDDVATATATTISARCMPSRQLVHGRNHRFGNEPNPELINATTKYGNNVLRHEFNNKIYATHKQHAYETDFIDSNLSKCKTDISTRLLAVSPLQQQKTNKHYGFDHLLLDDIGSKVNLVPAGNVPQNFKENLIKSRQFVAHELTTERIPNASGESSSINMAQNKSSVRRKTNDKSYRRSQYHKHSRCVVFFASFFFELLYLNANQSHTKFMFYNKIFFIFLHL